VPVEKWYELMPGSMVADAVTNRLVHNAHKIVLRGESMRKIGATAGRKGVNLEAEPTSVLLM
jgi:DNA replication protein DnaC